MSSLSLLAWMHDHPLAPRIYLGAFAAAAALAIVRAALVR
jgi:hypothetical protein